MTTQKNIEVEIRGPLTKEQRDQLVVLFEREGKREKTKDRVLIDYSERLEEGKEREKDIRIRSTNGVPEIIVKLGGWGGAEARKELSVTTAPGSFDTLAALFAALGYSQGVLCVRRTEVFVYKGIEFALVEVPDHSFHFEAEKMADEGEDAHLLLAEIETVCASLGLSVYSKEEFFAYVQVLNKEANEEFVFDPKNETYFKDRFSI